LAPKGKPVATGLSRCLRLYRGRRKQEPLVHQSTEKADCGEIPRSRYVRTTTAMSANKLTNESRGQPFRLDLGTIRPIEGILRRRTRCRLDAHTRHVILAQRVR